ncbi:hypothetical protein H310_05003 [Aphanomyces invadans]|uniref:BZIP domain-containing protein n=1 Tax=Aphanomyces invadans TaxID=157072 RepID=A0A024UD87_9STRA|nr:hypothetical protein H310_05003 [Aphanomyces invadans]ETW03593.1 hypothetical protein H310_05003 [Aphanomyces invadans]|eukprot:XP_008867822.1 hypothetical protein H310_05003 [Aphanomyces invadans]
MAAAAINLDEIDESINFCPEDDELLDYLLSGTGGPEGLLDELTLGAPNEALDVIPTVMSSNSATEDDYAFVAAATQMHAPPPAHSGAHHASVETASITSSAEFDAPDSPSNLVENDQDTDDEKRRKRLERNRISARESRARKKQYLELLKKKVAQLTEDIASARGRHLESADRTLSSLKSRLVSSLYDKIAHLSPHMPLDPTVLDSLRRGVQLLPLRFGPNSNERRAVVNYRFKQLDSLLLPPYTRFLLWMSNQDEGFYTKSNLSPPVSSKKTDEPRKDTVAKKDGLWSALSTELALTYEQEEKIKGHYRASDSKTAALERRKIAMAVNYLHLLKQNMAERGQAVQAQSDKIQAILTPDQTIRFHKWTITHRANHSASLKARSLVQVSLSSDISSILHKSDDELDPQDITTMLATLSKQGTALAARP